MSQSFGNRAPSDDALDDRDDPVSLDALPRMTRADPSTHFLRTDFLERVDSLEITAISIGARSVLKCSDIHPFSPGLFRKFWMLRFNVFCGDLRR